MKRRSSSHAATARRRLDLVQWEISVGAFTLLALYAVWAHRFPPMQDYSMHLFYVHVMQHYDDPAFDYERHYTLSLSPGPYTAFYVVTRLFSTILPLEAAGKLALGVYVLLTAWLVIQASRNSQHVPWGLLLFFPLLYRGENRPPAPGEYAPQSFTWTKHGRYYDYILIRGAPPGLEEWMSRHADTVAASGKWLLMRRRGE